MHDVPVHVVRGSHLSHVVPEVHSSHREPQATRKEMQIGRKIELKMER